MTVPFEGRLQVVLAELLQVVRGGEEVAAGNVDDHVIVLAKGPSAVVLRAALGMPSQTETPEPESEDDGSS